MCGEREREGGNGVTGFISLLVPLRIAGYVLRLLGLCVLLLLTAAALEHLLEELELRGCEGAEEGEEEEVEEEEMHCGVVDVDGDDDGRGQFDVAEVHCACYGG